MFRKAMLGVKLFAASFRLLGLLNLAPNEV